MIRMAIEKPTDGRTIATPFICCQECGGRISPGPDGGILLYDASKAGAVDGYIIHSRCKEQFLSGVENGDSFIETSLECLKPAVRWL